MFGLTPSKQVRQSEADQKHQGGSRRGAPQSSKWPNRPLPPLAKTAKNVAAYFVGSHHDMKALLARDPTPSQDEIDLLESQLLAKWDELVQDRR